ncbi:hypothetical protein ACU686_41770 [Yinghuangia aomiensis]
MRLRNLVMTVTASAALAFGGVLAAAPAQAAPATAACEHPCHSPGPGWTYITDYFWASACADTGNQGIATHRWNAYQCTGGSAVENYELWVR